MKVSIVITAYNVQDYIQQCIDSVLNQTYSDKEIIIVDDASTDNTSDILLKYEQTPLVKLYKNKINVGAGLSRRAGITVATGEYIMLLDGDDYIEQINHIEKLMTNAQTTGADVVSGGIKILKEDGSYDITSYGNTITEKYDKISKFWGERIVFMNNKIIRKSLYEKVPYCHRRYIEDTPVIIPILWYANKVSYIDDIGYVYRMRQDSLTHTTDIVKDVIYKGLCWCDLMDFFTTNDKEVFKHMNIQGYITNTINILNNIKLTYDAVKPYINEYIEFTIRLTNIIHITNINFKQPYEQIKNNK